MSDASDKLARSRQAILEHVARRHRKHDPRMEPADDDLADANAYAAYADDGPDPGAGWFRHLTHVVRTWWRYHPAHMVVELATPMMRGYARRKPMQLLGISLAVGAALTFARPWKVISITTILVALLKSSQMSHLFTAAMSAADYRKDASRPEWK
jgi:CO/xanthine dehydrogenase Mo-binding subunit